MNTPKEATSADISLPNDGLSLFDLEQKLLSQALERSDGNQTQAAKLVGLSLDTFRYRLKKYDL
jgi:DNA-binding protein Fis